jgi:SAM-dependent methyltransferase
VWILMDTKQRLGLLDSHTRVYDKYVSSGAAGLNPITLADFASRLPYLHKIVRTFFPADKRARVLDLGCGHGALLYVARQQGYVDIVGVDISAEQIETARGLGITEAKQSDLFAFLSSQQSASFDIVITFDVIEHLNKSSLMSVIDGVHRILKPTGNWLIHVPNAESPFFGRVRYGDFTHELAFTAKSLTSVLRSCNFDDVRCFEDPIVSHGIKSAIRFVLWKMIRTILRLYIAVETGEAGNRAIFTQNLLAVARPVSAKEQLVKPGT